MRQFTPLAPAGTFDFHSLLQSNELATVKEICFDWSCVSRQRDSMDNARLIRAVAGIFAAIAFVILIFPDEEEAPI